MNSIRNFRRFGLVVCAVLPALSFAATGAKQNLLGKFFVSSSTGKVTIVNDGRVFTPAKGDSFLARGTVIETADGSKVVVVFSNQTSVIVDENTRLEVEQFEQEFFPPNNNLRVEPSNSTSAVHLNHGRVLISTPALRSGTVMAYRTAHATVSIRGEKVMVESNEKRTHVLVIAGAATVDPRNLGGTLAVAGKRLITGEEAFLTTAGLGNTAPAAVVFQIPPPKRKAMGVAGASAPIPVKLAGTDYSITTDADGVLLTSPSGIVTLRARGISQSSAAGDQANVDNRQLARAAFTAATAAVANNKDGMTIQAATRLLTNTARVAASEFPEEAPELAKQAVLAIGANASAVAESPDAATAAVIDAIASAAPSAVVQIAATASTAAPKEAILIAAVTAKAVPAKAAQVAYAVVQSLRTAGGAADANDWLRNASAVAAAVANAAPDQSAFVAASVVQALLVPHSPGSPFTNADRAAAIAAAVAGSAPASAAAVVKAVFSVLQPALQNEPAALVSQAIARLGGAATSVVPLEAGRIAAALVQSFRQSYPDAGTDEIASTAGLLAATLNIVAPAQAASIYTEIASAANLSLASVQALSARSSALAAQINLQIPTIARDANFAAAAAASVSGTIIASTELLNPINAPADSAVAVQATAAGEPADGNEPDDGFVISPFDPASLVALAADLDAAQAAQTSVLFNTEPDENGAPTLRPVPTIPPTLPVELVTSPANGTG